MLTPSLYNSSNKQSPASSATRAIVLTEGATYPLEPDHHPSLFGGTQQVTPWPVNKNDE